VGYWNEDEKFVSTAAYIPGINETYGLQNRTYIVTTILVCLQIISVIYWLELVLVLKHFNLLLFK